jgi:alkylhydroperoxidase family enzyme
MSTIPTRPSTPRIAPAPPEEWNDRTQEFFDMVEGKGGRSGGTKLNVVLTLAQHPDLAIPYFTFGRYMLKGSSISPRLRELVTLRTAHLHDSDYEFVKHAKTARSVGMSDAEIEAIRIGADAANWSAFERAALRATDQLRQHTAIDDETWGELAAELSQQELLDLVFTIGSYAMLAMVLNAVGVQLEPE